MSPVLKQLSVDRTVRTSLCKYDNMPCLDAFPRVGGELLIAGHLPFLVIACPAFMLATIIRIHQGK
jgi:hypothetical protein